MRALILLLLTIRISISATVNWTNTVGLDSAPYGPGDTVMLWGTFTNKYTITNSGTAGSPITFAFASGAKFSKPTFTTGAIAVNAKSNITILNGFIECTDNGTALGNQVDSIGIDAYTGGGSMNLVISNMTVTNMYMRTYKSASDGNRYGVGINLGAWNGLWIMDCNLSDGDTMIGGAALNGQTMTNVFLIRNTILQCNHGMSIGTAGGAASAWIKSVVVASNRVDRLDYWDNHSNLHLDGFIFFHEATAGGFKDWAIYANEIGPNIGITNTAAIFMPVYANAAGDNIQIYNNLFTAAAGYSWNNGHVVLGYCTNSAIFNNTFYQNDRTGIGLKVSYGELAVSNNIFYNTGIAVYISGATLADFGGFIDYNVYYGSPALQFQVPLGQDTFAQWKSETGFDSNSITNQPLLDANYIPTSADTAAKNTGQNLSAWFTTDKNGVIRSDWYAGAFEFVPNQPSIGVTISTGIPNSKVDF